MPMFLENVRLSHPDLFVPTKFDANNPNEKAKYGGQFIMGKDHKDLPKLKNEIRKLIGEKWGEKPSGLKIALRDGAEKEDVDGYGPETVFFNAKNQKRPGVFDRDQSPLTAEDYRPYAGCYVNVRISVWAQDNKYGKRINIELNGVQFYGDGEAFGGGSPPSTNEDFPELDPSTIEGEAATEAGELWDDDIPF